MSQHFRAGVILVVRHPDGRQVLAVERSDSPGSWQLPQGGIDGGETPEQAAWRELGEELALGRGDVTLAAEHPTWTVSAYPPEIRARFAKRLGQVHRWFVFASPTDAPPVAPDPGEIATWRWIDPDVLLADVTPWRHDAYDTVLTTITHP